MKRLLLTGLPNRLGLTGTDLIIWGFALIFSFLLWWPARYMPYYWDSSGFIINTARDTYLSQFKTIVSAHTDFAHPPLFTMLLALFWTLFSESRLVSHLLMFPFLPLFIIATYHLLKTVVTRPYAALGAVLIAFSPEALAEYVNIYIDLPSAALVTAALYFYRSKRFGWGMASFLSAILIKLPVLTLLPLLILSHTSAKKKVITALIPLSIVIAWTLFHYQQTGWFLIIPGREINSALSNPQLLISNLLVTLQVIFIEQARFTWLVIIGSALIISSKNRSALVNTVRRHLPMLAASVTVIAFFVYAGEVAPRYILFFLPIVVAATMISLSKIQRTYNLSQLSITVIALILLSFQINYWRDDPTPTKGADFFPPDNLSIVDYVRSFREMTTTIQMLYPDSTVYGGFPENVMLTQPYQGYVSQPIEFFPCDQFQSESATTQLIVIHPYAPSQIACHQLLQMVDNSHISGFETNGKWVELYQINQPQ